MAETFRARFRFRLLKKLNIKDQERKLQIAGREVVLTAATPNTVICDSEWLVMNARGFNSKKDAQVFATRLKAACEFSSVSCRLGIDAGVDLPTAGLGAGFREHLQKETGIIVRDNIHGIDVFRDEPNVRVFSLSATGTVHASPDPFLSDLHAFYPVAEDISQRAKDIALLLNYALMRPEPVAQIVFSVSAVEMLGQDEGWSEDQKQMLEQLAANAERLDVGTERERSEVAAAIGKNLHRISLRQGVVRLLDHLGLGHLKKDWDGLYSERSSLVHGLAPKPGADYGDLAHRTMNICGQILLRAIAMETELTGKHVDQFYPIK